MAIVAHQPKLRYCERENKKKSIFTKHCNVDSLLSLEHSFKAFIEEEAFCQTRHGHFTSCLKTDSFPTKKKQSETQSMNFVILMNSSIPPLALKN